MVEPILDKISGFFRKNPDDDGSGKLDSSLRLSAAALLFESAMIDYEMTEEENATIISLISKQFSLSGEEAAALFSLAERQAKEATDLHRFTSLINKNWSEKDRSILVEHMWKVVYADGRLDDHELHLMRKIQRLLHIPHKEFMAAKLRQKPISK